MKLSEMFIGQLVQMKEKSEFKKLPEIGKVVDIALEYDTDILLNSQSDISFTEVLPVVHFVGETVARKVNPVNLEKLK